ncbi:MAG: tetratricopeptide repeat protein [Rhodothermales bacterium]
MPTNLALRFSHRFLCLIVVSLLCLTVLPAQAQRIITRGSAVPAGVDSSLVARFQLADTYLRGAQYDRAIALLEDLYATSPTTYVFFDRLKEAYKNVKRYDDAIALVDDRLEQTAAGDGTVLLAEKAQLSYLKGDEQRSFELWAEALPDTSTNQNVYRIIYGSMLEVRLLDKAIEVLEKGRETIGELTLFQADLAYLFSLTGQHERAMEEYLGLLALNDRQLNYVRNRLNRSLEQEGALDASIAATERAVRRSPLNRNYRELLGWLYLEAENYPQALNTYRAIDRLESENGRVLFEFAQKAADAQAYEAALEAFDEVLHRYPDTPVAAEVQLGLAELHERWADTLRERLFDDRGNRLSAPHYEAALDAYRTFLQTYPTHPFYPDVLRRMGRLQQDVFFNLGEADAALTEVAKRYPNTQAAYQARYDLGRIALMRGSLDEALLIFTRLIDQLRIGELAEQARFERALIHFYRGEFEAAQTLVSVLDENTSTDVANDAIELKVLLFENKGPDSLSTPLKHYAEAALLHRQRRSKEVVRHLDALLEQFGTHPLADDARFLRASALREAGRTEEALAAFGELPLIHPNTHLADRSLFMAAEIQELDLHNREGAIETYTRILTEYPGSLLVPEVRLRVRLLRGDGA